MAWMSPQTSCKPASPSTVHRLHHSSHFAKFPIWCITLGRLAGWVYLPGLAIVLGWRSRLDLLELYFNGLRCVKDQPSGHRSNRARKRGGGCNHRCCLSRSCARFPDKAISAARAPVARHIGATQLGGEGVSISDVVDVCYVLGRGCSSTALITPYIKSWWLASFVARRAFGILGCFAKSQHAVASGFVDYRRSRRGRCSCKYLRRQTGGSHWLLKLPPSCPWSTSGRILTTARRAAKPLSDQVLVTLSKEIISTSISSTGHSVCVDMQHRLHAQSSRQDRPILPDPYQKIHAHASSVAHLTWSGVWTELPLKQSTEPEVHSPLSTPGKPASPGAPTLYEQARPTIRGLVSSAARSTSTWLIVGRTRVYRFRPA